MAPLKPEKEKLQSILHAHNIKKIIKASKQNKWTYLATQLHHSELLVHIGRNLHLNSIYLD